MLMEATSSGFKDDIEKSSIGNPSTTYNGALLWVIEFPPLITIFDSFPGCPSLLDTCIPAILPPNASAKFGTGALLTSSTLTTPTEPVRSDFLTLPYAITTTSSNCLVDSCNEILITF